MGTGGKTSPTRCKLLTDRPAPARRQSGPTWRLSRFEAETHFPEPARIERARVGPPLTGGAGKPGHVWGHAHASHKHRHRPLLWSWHAASIVQDRSRHRRAHAETCVQATGRGARRKLLDRDRLRIWCAKWRNRDRGPAGPGRPCGAPIHEGCPFASREKKSRCHPRLRHAHSRRLMPHALRASGRLDGNSTPVENNSRFE